MKRVRTAAKRLRPVLRTFIGSFFSALAQFFSQSLDGVETGFVFFFKHVSPHRRWPLRKPNDRHSLYGSLYSCRNLARLLLLFSKSNRRNTKYSDREREREPFNSEITRGRQVARAGALTKVERTVIVLKTDAQSLTIGRRPLHDPRETHSESMKRSKHSSVVLDGDATWTAHYGQTISGDLRNE